MYYYGCRAIINGYAKLCRWWSSNELIAELGDKLTERRCKISYKAPLSPRRESREEVTNALVKVALMESRILVLLAYTGCGLQLYKCLMRHSLLFSYKLCMLFKVCFRLRMYWAEPQREMKLVLGGANLLDPKQLVTLLV